MGSFTGDGAAFQLWTANLPTTCVLSWLLMPWLFPVFYQLPTTLPLQRLHVLVLVPWGYLGCGVCVANPALCQDLGRWERFPPVLLNFLPSRPGTCGSSRVVWMLSVS